MPISDSSRYWLAVELFTMSKRTRLFKEEKNAQSDMLTSLLRSTSMLLGEMQWFLTSRFYCLRTRIITVNKSNTSPIASIVVSTPEVGLTSAL